jgi:pimeloyl-ACP methyl ester carboxylesterase
MVKWRRLSSVAGLATGVAAASAGAVIAAEKVAVGRIRLRPDPAADEPFGQLQGGRPVSVIADDGVRLHAEVCGPEDSPVTIVFCHGYTLSSEVWHYQRLDLEADYRLVFWDQRSHGRSGRSDPAHISIGQLGRDLAAVLAATAPGGTPVVLVGHSMGGMAIMSLADQHPGLFGTAIIGVVLISTTALVDPTGWMPGPLRPVGRWAAPALLRSSSQGRRAELTERLRGAAGDVAFLSARFIAFGDPDVSPTVVDFLEHLIRATPIEVVADFYLALTAHDERDALPTIGQVPTVVITGKEDRLVATQQTAELAAAIPGASLVRVPTAGHMVILERPELVTEEISDLVALALDESTTRRPA